MPCATLFGQRLRHLSTDFAPFYVLVAVVQVMCLFIYGVGIAAFSRPQECEPGTASGGQQYVLVFSLLGLFVAQAAICCGAVAASLRGTPLEPSKRRWVDRLSYAYLVSLPINAVLLAWGGWVVEAGDGSCWSSGNKRMAATIIFGGIGVLVGQAVGILLTYNQLSDVQPGVWWHQKTRTGLSSIVHLLDSWRQPHRGPAAHLEQLATQLQRLMACIDADKSDAAVGLACAALLQEEAAAAVQAAQPASTALHSSKKGRDGWGGNDVSAELLEWAQSVCCQAAPEPGEAAHGQAAAGSATAEEALHWARFAAAAYGARQHLWRRGALGARASRRQLSRAAAAVADGGHAPLCGWGADHPATSAAPSSAALKDYTAAKALLGPSAELVWLSRGCRKRRLLPHLVAIDRERQAVVLGIAGDWEQLHALPSVRPLPQGWLGPGPLLEAAFGAADATCFIAAGAVPTPAKAASAAAAAAADFAGDWVHAPSLEAAEVLLQELEASHLLQLLLGCGDSGPGGRGAPADTAATRGALHSMVMDCAGWQLILTGHGTGAGAAALLSLRLRHQHTCLAVWALAPPGQLCSANVGEALSGTCRMTSVTLGDDAVTATTLGALSSLVEQSLVGLARLRYSKTGLLAALVAERLGPRHWEGRWLNPARALRPLRMVPPEALAYLQRFRDWQRGQERQPPSTLPGLVLLLSRLPDLAKQATSGGRQDDQGSGGSSVGSHERDDAGRPCWRADCVTGQQLAARGLRVSRHALSDHRISRIVGVLSDLAAASNGAEIAADDAVSGQV